MSDFCLRWSILAIDVSLKTLLLAVITGCGLRLLRVRRSNLKHAAWLGVLTGMIGLPWLSFVLPAIPVPILAGHKTAPAAAVADSIIHAPPVAGLDAGMKRNLASPDWRGTRPDPRTVSRVERDVTGPTSSEESVAFSQPSSESRFVFRWPVIAFTIWGLGVLAFSARLALALFVTRQLVRRSTPIAANDPHLKDMGRAAWASNGLRKSSDISVPLTTGVLHPQILLPTDWKTWPVEKLRDVLVHEFTHIRRRDCSTALAAGMIAAVYWLNPLAWWLRRRLAVLAEDCCDDAAIVAAGDRAVYARHLLEIAMRLCQQQRRLHYVGLSMARQSDVERRILAILDGNRPISRMLTRSVVLLLVGLILPLIAVAAALKPVSESSTDQDSQAKQEATQRSPGKAEALEEKDYQGQVIGSDGQPLAGAEIWLAVSPQGSAAQSINGTLRRLAVSDLRGDFSFRLKPVENADEFPIEWTHYAALVAKAPGHGCDWLPLAVFERDAASSDERIQFQRDVDERLGPGRFAGRTLKLPREAGPVRGRLVDLEGRPLKGVAVSVDYVLNPDMALLREGLENASRDTVNRSLWTRAAPRASLDRRSWQALIQSVKTDDSGGFSLSGLGRDQMAAVTLSGEQRLRVTTCLQRRPACPFPTGTLFASSIRLWARSRITVI